MRTLHSENGPKIFCNAKFCLATGHIFGLTTTSTSWIAEFGVKKTQKILLKRIYIH